MTIDASGGVGSGAPATWQVERGPCVGARRAAPSSVAVEARSGTSTAGVDRDLELLPAAASDAAAGSALAALVDVLGGGVIERVAATMSEGRRAETRAAECAERAQTAEAESALARQREALEAAREAAEDAGFWGVLGEVACWVGAAAAVVAAIPSGGATLALAGVAAAAAIGSQHAADIAEALCDVGIVDRSDVADVSLGLSIGLGVAAAACGIGGAVAAAQTTVSASSQVAQRAGQVLQGSAGVLQGTATGGGAVCRYDEADARIDAERAEHGAEVAQEQREEMIELIRASAEGWCRALERTGRMITTVRETSVHVAAQTRA